MNTGSHRSYAFMSVVVIGIALGVGLYSYLRINALDRKINALSQNVNLLATNLSSTTAYLQASINDTSSALSNALNIQQQNVGAIRQQLGGFQTQVGTLSGTLTNLQKLAQTDQELLKKYSKVFFLNENYVPKELTEIPLSYQYSSSKQLLFVTQALPHLQAMIDAASAAGVKIFVQSAYRSFAEQRALKGDYTVVYGAGTANSFSADQGYSEHQLGTAVDLVSTGQNGQLDGFDKTAAYQWMVANAYKYGFILSYPKSNSYYIYEPWHWRYVGEKLAQDLHTDGKNFYDIDQRVIDTYLPYIFN